VISGDMLTIWYVSDNKNLSHNVLLTVLLDLNWPPSCGDSSTVL